MKKDCAPSLVIGTYCHPRRKAELIADASKVGFKVRELSILDFTVNLGKDYDKQINWLKHFMLCDYWVEKSPMNKNSFMINQMKKYLIKARFHPINFKEGDWEHDTRHKHLYSLAFPLMCQLPCKTNLTEQEAKNLDNLKEFKSKGYKPDKSPEAKNQKDTGFVPTKKKETDKIMNFEGSIKCNKCKKTWAVCECENENS